MTQEKLPHRKELCLQSEELCPTIPFPRNKYYTTNVQPAPFAKSRYHTLRRFVCKHPIAGSVILWLNYYYKLFTKRSNAF